MEEKEGSASQQNHHLQRNQPVSVQWNQINSWLSHIYWKVEFTLERKQHNYSESFVYPLFWDQTLGIIV